MHFFPILSTLRRHRTAATLIVLEIALSCAIVCNTIFLIGDRLSRMNLPSGIANTRLVMVKRDVGWSMYVWCWQSKTDVVGIEHLARPDAAQRGDSSAYSLVLPMNLSYLDGAYLLRVDPARGADVLAVVDATLRKVEPS